MPTKPAFKKVRHDKNLEIRHEGFVWHVEAAEWRRPDGTGELRIYRIEGPVHDRALMDEAFQLEADARGLVVKRT